MSLLQLEQTGYQVEKTWIVHPCSPRFDPEELTLLLGANGSGKTTLMQMAAGLLPPTVGRVRLTDGDGHPQRVFRQVCMVFQKPVLFAGSVKANLERPLAWRGLAKGEIRRRVDQALALSGLEEAAHQKAGSLSGGQAQRLALARAFALHPPVLLLDEPTANLDPQSGLAVRRMVAAMRKEFQPTVVMATHDLDAARSMGQKVYFLHQGRLEGPWEAGEFLANPPAEASLRYVRGEE